MIRKTVLLSILLSLVHIYCHDGKDLLKPEESSGAYIEILRKVPTMLEYLINTIQENPDVPEKDNVSDLDNNVNGTEPYHDHKDTNEEERAKKHVEEKDYIYAHIAPVARVTSEDVIKQVLKVQKRLEENNRNSKNKRE